MGKALRFWINTLQEFGRDTPTELQYGGGSYNLAELKQRGVTVEQAHDEAARAFCTDAEYELFQQHADIAVNDGRWRTYAGINYVTDSKPRVTLSTELAHWTDDEAWWARLREIAASHGATVDEMMSEVERGHWVGAELPANFSQLSDEDKRALPAYRPAGDEGRERTQVSVDFDITGESPVVRDEIMQRFNEATEDLWSEAGVNVL